MRRIIALLRPAIQPRRKISEVLALMPKNSTATMDADFARDIQAAIESHREPLEPPAWVDSSVVIAAERLERTAHRMLEAIRLEADDPEIAISVVTVLELAHGIVRADTRRRGARRQQFPDDLLAGMPFIL